MKPETKLAMRRWTIRTLRKLVDFIDERLHAAEVRLRDDLSPQLTGTSKGGARDRGDTKRCSHATDLSVERRENFSQWEARRSGVAPVSKKTRRRGLSAAEFDLRFAR